MTWKINWSDEAIRDLSKIEKTIAKRIIVKLEQATVDPPRFFSRLVGHEDYKLRIGEFRLIALLIHGEQTIFVEKIGHRKNIYKK